MSDGLTVPFALAAGLSGAVDASRVIVIAGLAEIAAGSIAMGLGGYLAAKNDAEHYENERRREEREIVEKATAEEREVREILEDYGVRGSNADPIVEAFRNDHEAWVDWMMRFELGSRSTATQTRRQQRRNHRHILRRRWSDSTGSIHDRAHTADSPVDLNCGHARGFVCFWVPEGPFYRNTRIAQRHPHYCHRRYRCGSGLRHRKGYFCNLRNASAVVTLRGGR